MISADRPLSDAVRKRIARTVSISGLHDLRPIMHTKMNDVLHLGEAEALSESAALLRPFGAIPLICWVGGGERPEFIRQSQLMGQMWEGLYTPTYCIVEGRHNHFTVIEGLRKPQSEITRCLLKPPT